MKLRNAVEISPNSGDSGDEMFGVQQGSDFLTSALCCPIDVEVQAESEDQSMFMRSADIGGETAHLLSASSKSMLRYYSHDGKTAHIPLLPFAPRTSSSTNVSGAAERFLGEWLVVCEICHAT